MITGLRQIAEIMDDMGLQWALIGGQAVNAWAEPRFTHDIDITVAADVESVARLRQHLLDQGWAIEHELGADLPSGPDFLRFTRGDDDPPLDVQVAKTAFQTQLLARAIRVDDGAIPVATPEDLVVLKLIAWRDKDEVDLQALSRLSTIDWGYVERWARESLVAMNLPSAPADTLARPTLLVAPATTPAMALTSFANPPHEAYLLATYDVPPEVDDDPYLRWYWLRAVPLRFSPAPRPGSAIRARRTEHDKLELTDLGYVVPETPFPPISLADLRSGDDETTPIPVAVVDHLQSHTGYALSPVLTPKWTVQDLVDLCDAAHAEIEDSGERLCTISYEHPPFRPMHPR